MTALIGLLASLTLAQAPAADSPHPAKNPQSPVMLRGAWVPENHHRIDFDKLPRLPAEHVVVSDVRPVNGVNQHNYLVHFDGRFWIMWSDGPGVEDRVGQVVKYATSSDGLRWDAPQRLTPFPPRSDPQSPHYNTRNKDGLRYIARGFWVREQQLLALASLDEAAGFFGPSLALHAFRWQAEQKQWTDLGVVQQDAINNFPPEKLPNGEWAMSRRTHDYAKRGVSFLVGGVKAFNDWQSFAVVTATDSTLKAEEPLWWVLSDGNLVSLFRDNRSSGFLFRSFSTDQGRTWSKPVRTDFPDASAKLHGLRLRDGRYVLVSNPHPKRRDPLTLAVSADGLVFDRMFYLAGGGQVDYPHILEREGFLYIAYAGGKQSVELRRVRLSDLDRIKMPVNPAESPKAP